jgi:ABC-type siderophore export system fused ATPase/permease subunit
MNEPRNPKYTTDWYLKWVASIIVLCAMSVRGVAEYAQIDLYLSIIGIGLWLWVSLIWNDRALILLNGMGLLFLLNNLWKSLV